MAKHLEHSPSTVQFDKYHGGRCIWGLLPFHLSSFKKLKSYTRPKHEGHSKYGLKKGSRESGNDEENESRKRSSTCSAFVCIRENPSSSTSNNNDEEYESRKRNSSCNVLVCIGEYIYPRTSSDGKLCEGKATAQPRLKRTSAVHHIEPSSNYLGDQKVDLRDSGTEKTVQESKHLTEQDESDHGDGDEYQPGKTSEDFFDAFKIDKKLFMKNTRKSDADRCDRVSESQKKVTLRRSRSYPAASDFGNRYGNFQPSKLEDKLVEVWPSGSSTASLFSLSSPSSSTSTTFSSSSHQTDSIKLFRSHSMVCKLPKDRSSEGSKHRRTLSLNGSMERYTQLLDTGFRSDLKLNRSNSLKVSTEDGVDNNQSDSTMLQKAHSMREALQVERSCSIELPKELIGSETLTNGIYFHEQSDLEVNEDEPVTTDVQNAAHTSPEYIFPEIVSRPKDIIDLADLPNALKQLVDLGTAEDFTGIKDDLEEQLLSHLMNELLYDVYEDCDAYYWPASLGTKCCVHPQPLTEDQVSRKVFSRIQKLRVFVLEASNDVKSVTAHDIANSYGWMNMNLQVDAECVGLALEEMFFDELLEELIYE